MIERNDGSAAPIAWTQHLQVACATETDGTASLVLRFHLHSLQGGRLAASQSKASPAASTNSAVQPVKGWEPRPWPSESS